MKLVDTHRRFLEFKVGDERFLKISPSRGITQFDFLRKLSPMFIRLFYSMVQKSLISFITSTIFGRNIWCISHINESHVLDHWELELRLNLSFKEQPVVIINRQEKVLRKNHCSCSSLLESSVRGETMWEWKTTSMSSFWTFLSKIYVLFYPLVNIENKIILLRGMERNNP